MDAIAPDDEGAGVLALLVERLRGLLHERGIHPSRTVVLVPYAQLMPLARRWWAQGAADGFLPRFETTMNWAARTGFAPGPTDLSFDRGLDLLTARHWLDQAGLSAQSGLLAPRLVDAAWQLAAAVAPLPVPQRPDWAARARGVIGQGLDTTILALECAIARIAVEWVAASAHATDRLLAPSIAREVDLLVVLEGLQPDPVALAIAAVLADRAVCWKLDDPAPRGTISLHPASDPAHEAEMAAACVMRHLQAGRSPVALAAVDRALTRRIRAMLGARGVALADETGWKLSTTRASAHVMTVLRACARDAGSDVVIDWLKHSPVVTARTVTGLEQKLRRLGLRDWEAVQSRRPGLHEAPWAQLLDRIQGWREALQAARPLVEWLQSLHQHLQQAGAWERLAGDEAGARLVTALGLDEAGQAVWARQLQGRRRLSLAEFTAWVNEGLEAASFVPQAPARPEVVVLPLSQLLGRRFPALVLPGCDEVRLAPSPEPPGPWTAGQRLALGLPTREALEEALREGWRHALQTPQVDVLWRTSDERGETLLPSALVQQLSAHPADAAAPDPRWHRALTPAPTRRPAAEGAALPVTRLSASAYEDLRRCPYRFFALRQLGLQQVEEIDTEIDKRDFGTWVHEVLCRFHRQMQQEPACGRTARAALLDRLAAQAARELHLPEGEFLPFEAAWPQVREGYLDELEKFEAREQARFESAETDHDTACGPHRLVGRIDRIDRLPDGQRMVMDYKTESLTTTQARLRQPMEDTQLAFYAALLEDESIRAAYVNVGERGDTRILEQPEVMAARQALRQGLQDDLRRIAQGQPMHPLGEGAVCTHCAARGLCRKDFWIT